MMLEILMDSIWAANALLKTQQAKLQEDKLLFIRKYVAAAIRKNQHDYGWSIKSHWDFTGGAWSI
jgi:hypothetical protein